MVHEGLKVTKEEAKIAEKKPPRYSSWAGEPREHGNPVFFWFFCSKKWG
jgi:hypothetical protein